MNDRIKNYQVTRSINHQITGRKADTYFFYFGAKYIPFLTSGLFGIPVSLADPLKTRKVNYPQ